MAAPDDAPSTHVPSPVKAGDGVNVFQDETWLGNEQATKKGTIVPEDAVGIAYFKTPGLHPKNNAIIIDTSRVANENAVEGSSEKKIYYANSLGILEDEDGNQIVDDEFPFVTDAFTVDEDWSQVEGSEYTPETILPFVHVSRFFHIDFSAQATSGGFFDYRGDNIKVIYEDGREYLDASGLPKYRVKLASVHMADDASTREQCAYRVHVYVDRQDNELLYLVYSKVEVTNQGMFRDLDVNYKELLNPIPLFEYQPEESIVIDPRNKDKKWFSTRSASLREQILDLPIRNVDGYRVYVPRKAVGDTRIFQLFRWRVKCSFKQAVEVDPTRAGVIRVGIAITNADPKSRTPYAFYNLARSNFNTGNLNFINPLNEGDTSLKRDQARYWYVDMDTVSNEDLRKFDIILWSPSVSSFDFSKYTAKINFFAGNGGTLFVDTNSFTRATGIGFTITAPIHPRTGSPRGPGLDRKISVSNMEYVSIFAGTDPNRDPRLMLNGSSYGGWNVTGNTRDSISYVKKLYPNGHCQYIGDDIPSHYTSIIRGERGNGDKHPVVARWLVGTKRNHRLGSIVWSTYGIALTCSALYSYADNALVAFNQRDSIYPTDNYDEYINSSMVEGAMKVMYNTCLLALKSRILDDADEKAYSTEWTYSTNWFSSWTINAANDVLSDSEKNKYNFTLQPSDLNDSNTVWQRRLSSKTVKQLVDSALTAEMQRRTAGAIREYSIEVTNPLVSTSTTLSSSSYPYAWTEAYSPKFTVPADIGPHVVRSKEIEGDYEAGQYISRSYPPRPYAGQLRVAYTATFDSWADETVHWTAQGVATERIKVTTQIPPSRTTITSNVELSWDDYSTRSTASGLINPYKGVTVPSDIRIGQDFRYTSYNSWLFWGMVGRWREGSTGEVVAFLQEALNRFQFWNIVYLPNGKPLEVDGYYGSATKEAIRAFQSTLGAKYIDGVVDAETMSLIGGQILRLGRFAIVNTSNSDHTRFFQWALDRMRPQNISDRSPLTSLAKRSWITGGPSVIYEDFFLKFDDRYRIYGITVNPFLEGDTSNVRIAALDVRNINSWDEMAAWSSNRAILHDLPFRAQDGQRLFTPFWAPQVGNVIAATLVQDRASFGSSRMLGLRELVAHAEVETEITIPGSTVITHQTREIPVTATGTVEFRRDRIVTRRAHAVYTGSGEITDVDWNSITTDSPSVRATITSAGAITLMADIVDDSATLEDDELYVFGPRFPGSFSGTATTRLYSSNEDGVVSPMPETGFISKDEGIKLLTYKDGTPWGFRNKNNGNLFPLGTGPHDLQRHYVKLILDRFDMDDSIRIGFYDKARKEFIQSQDGSPEISYIEYLRRGPSNIYVGMVSNYELVEQVDIPESDTPMLPYRWAMPVYGVMKPESSRISIEPLPPSLGRDEIWPVPIRVGSFSRAVSIRSRQQGIISGYLALHQGTTVKAFYSIPEADYGGWSSLYGPPNADVIDEIPLILDDNVIQVKQAPILMHVDYGSTFSYADPVRPVFTLYKRLTVNDPWVAQPWSEIIDVNASTGEIFLATPLGSNARDLVKISYVSHRRNYHFKGRIGETLNLNPYPGESRDLVGKPIYIYLEPTYVKDSQGHVIDASVNTNTIRFTTNTEIFSATSIQYNPLAYQLGIIYISTAFDIDDLILMDTRRRGGGVPDILSNEEAMRTNVDAKSFWDIGHGNGGSYPKGGYMVIRLPSSLKDTFSQNEIDAVIKRNITAGVHYKLEDLYGNDW